MIELNFVRGMRDISEAKDSNPLEYEAVLLVG